MSSDSMYSSSNHQELHVQGSTMHPPANARQDTRNMRNIDPEFPIVHQPVYKPNRGTECIGNDRSYKPTSVYPVLVHDDTPSIPPVVPLEDGGIPPIVRSHGGAVRYGANQDGNDGRFDRTIGSYGVSPEKAVNTSDQDTSSGISDSTHDSIPYADEDAQQSLGNDDKHDYHASGSGSMTYQEDMGKDVQTKANEVCYKKGIDSEWDTSYDKLFGAAREKYVYFWKNDSVFSQWHQSEFFLDDQTFTFAEQYMMYMKAVIFDDRRIKQKILYARHPAKIKSLGRKVNNFDEDVWSSNCLHIVKEANIAKFSQNERMKRELFATYPKLLVEASPVDAVWGIGLDKYDSDAWDEKTWKGRNLLGYILTEVRDELMCNEGIIRQEDKQVYIQKLQDENHASRRKHREATVGTRV